MKIYHSLSEFIPVKNAVVTIGTFDGVHLGHRKLIEKMKAAAVARNGETVLLTFFPHPRMVLYPEEHGVELLTTMREKIELLSEAGIDHLVIHAFDKTFSELSSDQFISDIIVKKLQTSLLITGHDHRFGKHREGSFEKLLALSKENNYEVEKIDEEDVNNITVSSTRIRNALKEGKVETAKAFLGRYYSLTGMVVHGKKLGRTIGFPTANLYIPENYKLFPFDGVYIAEVIFGKTEYMGMLNIGKRPTVEEHGKLTIEVYLINFDGDLYDKELTVKLIHRVRDDIKFDSLELLTAGINKDLAYTLDYIQKR